MNSLRRYSAWIWLLGALAVVGLLSVVTAGGSSGPPPLDVSSAQADGSLALDLWLQRLGYHLRATSNANLGLTDLPPQGSSLVLLMQGVDIPAQQIPTVMDWVRRGGRLVVAADGSTEENILQHLGVRLVPAVAGSVRLSQPLLLSPPVSTISAETSIIAQAPGRFVTVASTADGPVLTRADEGSGMIWILTAPSLLDNAHLARAEKREVLLNLVGPIGANVLVDQYVPPPPAGSGNSDWLTSTAWGVAFLFALTVLVLYRWLSGWRLGPAIVPIGAGHRAAAEYVVSIACLLRKAHRREDVLRVYQAGLHRVITERFGGDLQLVPAEYRERVARLLEPPGTLDEGELLEQAEAIVECERQARISRV